ncbi:MAG: response regulator, partial [Betaproteobacteria bacterium]|nr:response regulator [Betaproteobacteria bacterium]
MSVRAVIAEDEPLLAQQLKSLLGRAWPELEIAATVANGLEALQAIERERPQVAFLDIRMPG